MKNVIFILIICLFVSCYPSYGVLIENRSFKDIYIRTEPTVESFLAFKDSFYDAILSQKINNSETIGIYKIKSKEKIRLFAHRGKEPLPHDFRFKTVKIINGEGDTIGIDGNNIKEYAKKIGKNNFYIEIHGEDY